MTRSASDLITEKGGPAAFASAIGKKSGAVRMMKQRNRIPRTVWPEVIGAFPDVTLEVLRNVEKAS